MTSSTHLITNDEASLTQPLPRRDNSYCDTDLSPAEVGMSRPKLQLRQTTRKTSANTHVSPQCVCLHVCVCCVSDTISGKQSPVDNAQRLALALTFDLCRGWGHMEVRLSRTGSGSWCECRVSEVDCEATLCLDWVTVNLIRLSVNLVISSATNLVPKTPWTHKNTFLLKLFKWNWKCLFLQFLYSS